MFQPQLDRYPTHVNQYSQTHVSITICSNLIYRSPFPRSQSGLRCPKQQFNVSNKLFPFKHSLTQFPFLRLKYVRAHAYPGQYLIPIINRKGYALCRRPPLSGRGLSGSNCAVLAQLRCWVYCFCVFCVAWFSCEMCRGRLSGFLFS